MSARRSSQPSVQLFPFLAVLMCALGALILLLLVITSRMRDQARTRAIMARSEAVAEAAPAPGPVVRPVPPPRRDRWQPTAAPPTALLQPALQPKTPPAPEPIPSLRQQWLRTVTDLQAAAAKDESALTAHRAAAAAEEAALEALSNKLAALRQQADALTQRRSKAEDEREQSAAEHAALQRAVAQQEAAIEQRRVQQAAAASRFSILPYDGRSGTVRRPIYIECREDGLVFASEQIRLTPEQLNGFPALRNPLLAGADALIDYWSLQALKDAGASPAGAPYVLLIVRPSGTIGYYVARRMLESLGQPFGYELIAEEMQLQYPPTDPAAAKACQAAIDAVLQDREHLVVRSGVVAPGSLEPLSVSDGRGAFALEEVDRLRGGGRTVHFGGRTFDRNSSRGGSSPGRTNRIGDEPAGPAPAPFPNVSAESRAAGDARDVGAGSARGSPQMPASAERTGAAQPPSAGSSSSASESASAFSAAAGRRSRMPGDRGAGPAGDPADQAPRPLPSLDAEGMGNRTTRRTASRNPTEVLRDPGSAIGLERKVVVRISSQQVVVESESPIIVLPGTSREELQAQLAQTLRTHFEGWGRPPRGFYWLPQVKYSVLPGGHQHLKRLTDLTDEWEIRSDVDFALE